MASYSSGRRLVDVQAVDGGGVLQCLRHDTNASTEKTHLHGSILTVTSWANSGTRDLHLDLRHSHHPGARGATGRTAQRSARRRAIRPPRARQPCCRRRAAWPPTSDWPATRVAEAYAELVAEGWLASRQGAGTWVVNVSGRSYPPRPRGVARRSDPQSDAGLPGRLAVSPQRLGGLHPAGPDRPRPPRRCGWAIRCGRPELREALAEYLGRVRGVRTIAGVDRDLRGHPARRRAVGAGVWRPDRRRGLRAVPLPRSASTAMGVRRRPIGRRRGRRGDRRPRRHRCGDARAAHPRPPLPAGRAAAPGAAHRGRSTGRSAPTATCSRTTTTASSATTASPSARCRRCDPDRVVYLGSASKSLSPVLRLGWMVLPDDTRSTG